MAYPPSITYPLPFPEYSGPLHILVVDDQEFDRDMICTRLREAAPTDTVIVEAASGAQTLRAIEEASVPFHCVLLDMNLHDIHGVELTSMILHLRPETSVIMITVEADMDKALKCIKAGAEDFLIKGEYSNMGLYRAVRYAIERRRVSLENFRLNEALKRERELSAAQREFIHLVSHEFRTPIAIISGAMQLLASKAPELAHGAGAPQFKKVNDAITRLVRLLDNVLRLSLVEEGKAVFTPALFDMCETIRHVSEYFDPQRLECVVGDKPLHYYGDQPLVEYALHNVISNGIKYSPPESKVSIRLNAFPAGLEILVTDHGSGMSSETIAQAGEKFYRASKTSHIEGTGLGIHLAKRFMEYHSGTLTFDSELGKGTTVRLFFPYSAALVDKPAE